MHTTVLASLQSLIDAHANPFVLIDRDYRVVAANDAYRRAYGLAAGETIGRRCYQLSHHHDRPCHERGELCPHQQVFEHGTDCQVLHTHYDQAGCAEHVQIRGHVISAPDGARLLGESIFRVATQQQMTCDDMRLIGNSPAFLRAVEHLTWAAQSSANILLHGESGVGKELAAHYVHQRSARHDRPYVALDCAALTESLFESEIFGHERGAFTGAVARRTGLFELADGGTLFLDEVGELSAPMQAKLLRVLETGEFRRVGGRELLHADVRVIAATNRNLMAMVQERSFREDLYYRVACITIDLPPLRARHSDIPALADALLARINRDSDTHCQLSSEAMERLMHYDYPGNVRELRNILQRAVAQCAGHAGTSIGPRELGLLGGARAPVPVPVPGADRPRSLRELELDALRELLVRYQGRRKPVAEALGISERTLYRKLRRHGLG